MNAVLNMQPDIKKGLEGVIADATSVSDVDGQAGRLYYRGYTVESLNKHTFADVAHLIVFGDLPNAARQAEFEEYLWQAGQLPQVIADFIVQLSKTAAHPMEILQAAGPLLAIEPPTTKLGRTPEEEEGLIFAARLPAAIALILATRQQRPFFYSPSRRYGERYLHMLTGVKPIENAIAVFEQTQILQLDHSFNASTFTARVITSTLAPPASALAGALGALYGPLHGRADQAALEMAEEIGSPSNARAYVTDCVANKKLVMGMGHREYRVVDPRAKVIKQLADRIASSTEHRRLFDTLVEVEKEFVEQTAAKSRSLRANLEFYKGVVYLALGIPKDYFTASFAASRVFGWLAHVVEQRKDNRIIRPSAHYTGPAPREA
jgi:citrate synthase